MIEIKILESFKKLDDIIITDYAGDVLNLFLNKPKAYRVVYVPQDDLYLLGNALNNIHKDIIIKALDAGWLPNLQSYLKQHKMTVSAFERNEAINFIFLPISSITSKFGTFSDDYITVEYKGAEYPLKTGSVFTKDIHGKDFLKNNVPELYNKLMNNVIDDYRVLRESEELFEYDNNQASLLTVQNQLRKKIGDDFSFIGGSTVPKFKIKSIDIPDVEISITVNGKNVECTPIYDGVADTLHKKRGIAFMRACDIISNYAYDILDAYKENNKH